MRETRSGESGVAGDSAQLSFDTRYLAAKKLIDDRSLNHQVWTRLDRALLRYRDGKPLNVLEIGAGIGTMLERMVDRGLLTGQVNYLATDNDATLLEAAHPYLTAWAKEMGHSLAWSGQGVGELRTSAAHISLRLVPGSAEELAARGGDLGSFQLQIAHGLLDLVDFPVILPRLFSSLSDRGLALLTCNFDGETLFFPELPEDREIIGLYHGSMERRLEGASHTGRRLLSFLQGSPLQLLAAGSSDWVIRPRDRTYRAEELFFLGAMIDMVEGELFRGSNPPGCLTRWTRLRHRQLMAGKLSLVARHLDFLAGRRR